MTTGGGAGESTGPPDRQTLRLLEGQFAEDALVEGTAFDPDPYEPRLLRVHLVPSRYPEAVRAATLDVRWFVSGDFSFHYVERERSGDGWECRWDRHPNEHNARLHFHRPPDGREAEDLSLPSTHPLDLYSTVLDAIEKRLRTRWGSSGE